MKILFLLFTIPYVLAYNSCFYYVIGNTSPAEVDKSSYRNCYINSNYDQINLGRNCLGSYVKNNDCDSVSECVKGAGLYSQEDFSNECIRLGGILYDK